MDLNAYQAEALTTAVYPLARELDYTIVGLLSEVGELAEVYYDAKTVTENSKGWTAHYLNEALSETGDCYWYTAAIADALRTTLGQIVNGGQQSTIALVRSRGLTLTALSREAGAIAGILKKTIRDDAGKIDTGKKQNIEYHLLRVLALLDHFCEMIGSTPHSAMNKNLNKLSDRKARGTLKGSGNNR